jgi:nucleotide-binding universal stress UspA family protein
MQRFMVATDGSDGAERAVKAAATLAKLANGELIILMVSEDRLSEKQIREFQAAGLNEGDALEAINQRILARATVLARECGATNVKTTLSSGDPAEMIIDWIQRGHIDAVVVGRRGRGQLTGLLLGSVSQKLVSLAPCVVIVVP